MEVIKIFEMVVLVALLWGTGIAELMQRRVMPLTLHVQKGEALCFLLVGPGRASGL